MEKLECSPKLKAVMEQIKTILKENDVAGSVVLHTPGYSEFFNFIEPSYSVAKIISNGIHIKAKKDDPRIADTVNMIMHLATLLGQISLEFYDVHETLEKSGIEITHF